jgi:hypothetical protein
MVEESHQHHLPMVAAFLGFLIGGGNHSGYQQGPTQSPGYIPPGVFHDGQPQNPAQYHFPANAPGHAHVHQQPYLNLVKQFANWNIC